MPNYPLPIALVPETERVIALFFSEYGISLTHHDAKNFLERVMQFIYLTEVEDVVSSIQNESSDKNKPGE